MPFNQLPKFFGPETLTLGSLRSKDSRTMLAELEK